ncbi:hypothetical protein GWI33_010918 [Rhynchophorus ferrugineus]|uniref:Uncharacterized protein n=1 Tax=Rhynchophorus ferrugineus TaxID=354439 RepID=A0A834MF56_RHYFE|nr:hypothetical protein GWI33_010918 [Rhynchophorus ferrugineus]
MHCRLGRFLHFQVTKSAREPLKPFAEDNVKIRRRRGPGSRRSAQNARCCGTESGTEIRLDTGKYSRIPVRHSQ